MVAEIERMQRELERLRKLERAVARWRDNGASDVDSDRLWQAHQDFEDAEHVANCAGVNQPPVKGAA